MKQISYYLILLVIIGSTVVVVLNNKSQVYINGCTRRLTQNTNTSPNINPVSSQPKSSFNDLVAYLEYFPIYPGAMAIEITCSESSGDEQHQGLPVYRTIKSYEVAATPEQLAEFYVQPIREYNWLFLDTATFEGLEPRHFLTVQSGTVNVPEDVIFSGEGHGINNGKAVSISTELSIRASQPANGKSRVKLKIVESEIPKYPGP